MDDQSHCCSVTQSCVTFCDPMDCSIPGFPVLHYLLEFAQIHVHESVMLSNHLILYYPLLLPSVFPSIRVFFRVCSLNQMAEVNWSFSISPSNEYSGLISFTIAWFDLLAVQGDSQESSPAPQFESINSLVLSLLYGSTLPSLHNCWKNHGLDYIDLCQ